MSKLFVNTIAPNSGDTVTVSGSLTTTGKLTIGDATSDTVSFVSEISSSLIPDVGATYDLGTMANSWRNLHAHGLGHIHTASINVVSSSLLPDTGATYALGTMAKSWGSLHVHGLAHIHTASIGVVTSSLIPDKDSAFDLGSSTKEWKDLYIDGTANVDAISIEKTTAASQDLNTSAEYSVNGSKVEVRAITDSSIADGAFATFKLLNTSIATDSVIYGAFTGNHSNSNMSSSIISVATIAASTASVFIHNETGGAIAADTPFTASFIVL